MTTINTAIHSACAQFNAHHAYIDNSYYRIDDLSITDNNANTAPYIYDVTAVINHVDTTDPHHRVANRILLDCTVSTDTNAHPFFAHDSYNSVNPAAQQRYMFESIELTITPYSQYLDPITISSATLDTDTYSEPDSVLYNIYDDDVDPYKPECYQPYPHEDTFEHIFALVHEVISTQLHREKLDA